MGERRLTNRPAAHLYCPDVDLLVREKNAMKKQVYLFASAIAGLLAVAGNPAAADPCLTQPNPLAGSGHWYYRIDRSNQRKCWYLRSQEPVAQRVAPQAPPSQPTKHRHCRRNRAASSGCLRCPLPCPPRHQVSQRKTTRSMIRARPNRARAPSRRRGRRRCGSVAQYAHQCRAIAC